MARAICGPTHGKLVVFSSVIGALVMVWADVLSRALFAPEEVPIGVLTSIVGAPIFLWIVTHRYGEEQS
jgi:iron complex transport system permease protein